MRRVAWLLINDRGELRMASHRREPCDAHATLWKGAIEYHTVRVTYQWPPARRARRRKP